MFQLQIGTIKSRFHYLKTQNYNFHDFLGFGPVTKPQNQHYLSLETPGHLKQIKKNLGTSWKNIIFGNLRINKYENFGT